MYQRTELPQLDKTSSVYIRDAKAAIMPGDSFSTFDNLASAYQCNLLVEFDKADTVLMYLSNLTDTIIKILSKWVKESGGQMLVKGAGNTMNWVVDQFHHKKNSNCSFKQTGTRCFSL